MISSPPSGKAIQWSNSADSMLALSYLERYTAVVQLDRTIVNIQSNSSAVENCMSSGEAADSDVCVGETPCRLPSPTQTCSFIPNS